MREDIEDTNVCTVGVRRVYFIIPRHHTSCFVGEHKEVDKELLDDSICFSRV